MMDIGEIGEMKRVVKYYDKNWKEIGLKKAEYIQLERWDKGELVFQILLVRGKEYVV